MKLLTAVWSFIKGRLSGQPVITAKKEFGASTMTEIKLQKLFEFKTSESKIDFDDTRLDYRLKIILYALAGFVYWTYGKQITITEIFRTQEMQDNYYKDDPLYQQKKWLSTHQMWRAADISVYYFTEYEIKRMTEFLCHFDYATVGKSTFLIHDVGQGKHLHLQTDNENYTKINK